MSPSKERKDSRSLLGSTMYSSTPGLAPVLVSSLSTVSRLMAPDLSPASGTSPPPPSSPSPPSKTSAGYIVLGVLTIIVGFILFVGLLFLLFSCCVKVKDWYSSLEWHRSPRQSGPPVRGATPKPQIMPTTLSPPDNLGERRLRIFTYQQLEDAADSFSSANILGSGGFGTVYRGKVNETDVAIKQLKSESNQGECFRLEIKSLSRVNHKHLVSLLGYCNSRAQKLLVYEFLPNNTLDFHLHENNQPLDWPARLRIATGTAKGLAYLHEECNPTIIHLDIKSANILLDKDFVPKVADFGLARLFPNNRSSIYTDNLKGTFGYLAPEYVATGRINAKLDVFSFGAVLLEIITGYRPSKLDGHPLASSSQSFMDDSLVPWVRPLLAQAINGGEFDSLVDPRLKTYDANQMARMIACAAVCMRCSPEHRPNMSEIVSSLEGYVCRHSPKDIFVGVEPSSSAAALVSSRNSSDYYSGVYGVMMKRIQRGMAPIISEESSRTK